MHYLPLLFQVCAAIHLQTPCIGLHLHCGAATPQPGSCRYIFRSVGGGVAFVVMWPSMFCDCIAFVVMWPSMFCGCVAFVVMWPSLW